MLTRTLSTFAAASFLLFSYFVIQSVQVAGADVGTPKCTTSTITAVPVGNQLSVQVLATSTNDRAWARIQQVRDSAGVATSSLSVAFNADVQATANNGLQLSTSTPTIDFGINTDFPYTGAVQVLASSGSTTVRVTECKYASF